MDSYIALSSVSIILSLLLAWQIKSKFDKDHQYNCFIRLMLAVPVWSLFAMLEIVTDAKHKVLFSQLSYIGVVSVPVLWLLFSLEYSEKFDRLKHSHVLLLWIIPVLSLLIVATNGWHGLFWTKTYPDETFGDIVLYKYERGPLFYLNLVYAYIMYLSGLIIFLTKLRKSKILRDSLLIILGIITPFVSNFLYMARIAKVDYAPAALSFSCFCFAWAIAGGFFERNMAIAETIHKNMEEGIALIDDTFKIINMNPYARRIVGAVEWRGEAEASKVINFWDTLKYKLHDNADEYLEIDLENRCYGIHVYSITKESRLSGWIMNLTDITVKKQVEKELEERSIAAEAANVAKSNFVASMSHEIRTPLNGMIGFLDVLSQTRLDREQQDYLAEMRNASDNLLYMVNNVLDFSKIEASKVEIENVSYHLHQLVEDVVSLFAPKTYSNGVEIHAEIKKGVPAIVRGDALRLRQVLNNLIGNAVKFTHQGDIVLSVDLTKEENDSVTLSFEVSDTGIGISSAVMDKIFQPFTQADSSTTRKYGGTGLGLAISKKLLELMGSTIEVQSRENEGTRFRFYLTLEKGSCEVKALDAKGRRILVLDDHAVSKRILRAYLEDMGFCVCESEGGNDEPFDAVILDVDIFNRRVLDEEKSGIMKDNTLFIMVPAIKRSSVKASDYHNFSGFISKPLRKNELYSLLFSQLTEKTAEAVINRINPEQSASIENKRNILLVEDMEANRKLAEVILKKAGYDCDIAVNGKEAFEICRGKTFDLILMDCQMPVMDGYEATRSIKSEGTNQKTPIIAMTANALEGDRQKCLEAGMDDFITKPLMIKKVDETIKKWLTA